MSSKWHIDDSPHSSVAEIKCPRIDDRLGAILMDSNSLSAQDDFIIPNFGEALSLRYARYAIFS